MTVAGSGDYKAYYCASAKEKCPSVCTGFRGLRDSKALPLVLDGLREGLMQPDAYETFRHRFHQRLRDSLGAAEDQLRVHDARVRELETSHRNLLRAIETGDDVSVLLPRLNAVDTELKAMRGKRGDIVPPEIELPENLPEVYREMVRDLAATLSQEDVAGRAADELHELVERIVVHWDGDARGHWLAIEGNLLEMLRKTAPVETSAVREEMIFAEVGCGGRI